MKYTLLLVFFIPFVNFGQESIVISSAVCGGKELVLGVEKKETLVLSGESSAGDTTVIQTILTEKRLDSFCQGKGMLTVRGERFTGFVTDHYPNEQVKYSAQYKNGTPKGSFNYFSVDGTRMCSVKLRPNKAVVRGGCTIMREDW